jgi:two-component system chemotaxis response regulator CheY
LNYQEQAFESPKSILIVDDERSFCDVVAVILEGQGFNVQQASHANQALGLMSQTRPDLILTDLMMPEIDGFKFISKVRERPNWADIPVVMVSAHDQPEIQESAIEAGATGFMAKPFSASELRDTVWACFTEN